MDRDKIAIRYDLLICENAQNGEGVRNGTPPGFIIKDDANPAGQNGLQAVQPPALPAIAAEQGGDETAQQGGEHPARAKLVQMLPELPQPARMIRGGRPTVMTPQVKEQLCLLLSLGLSKRQAASYLDFDQSTITRAASRDPDFARGLARAEDLRVTEPLLHIVAESRRNWRAAAWLVTHAPKIKSKATAAERKERHELKKEKIRLEAELTQLRDEMAEERKEATKQREYARDRAFRERDAELYRQEQEEERRLMEAAKRQS
jgi:hypothetical protein